MVIFYINDGYFYINMAIFYIKNAGFYKIIGHFLHIN